MLHDELLGTNNPQARNLFIKGCSLSQASLLKGYFFPVRKPNGISENKDNQFSLVGLSWNSLVPHLGVNFVLP